MCISWQGSTSLLTRRWRVRVPHAQHSVNSCSLEVGSLAQSVEQRALTPSTSVRITCDPQMFKCDLCNFETDSREQFAGHRSGHVRRGECPKRTKSQDHICKICGLKFDSGPMLGGHLQFHRKMFEELVSEGAQKSRLLVERGHRCEVCTHTMWGGKPIPIELDHIDGNPENSSRENLRLICPNCHAQTPTYKGKNIGKVQNSKRQKKLKKYYGLYR